MAELALSVGKLAKLVLETGQANFSMSSRKLTTPILDSGQGDSNVFGAT